MARGKISKFALPEIENTISEENAMKQVMILLVRYDIDVESKIGDDKKAIEDSVQRMLRDIMNGRLEVFKSSSECKH